MAKTRLRNPLRLLLVVTFALVLVACFLSLRPTLKLTLSNAGLVLEEAPAGGVVTLLAAVALVGSAVLREGRFRWAAVSLALILALAGVHHLLFRLEVGPEGLALRGLRGSRALAWWDVTRVDANPEALEITVHGGGSLRIATGSFTPEQRAALERTVSRLYREAQGQTR